MRVKRFSLLNCRTGMILIVLGILFICRMIRRLVRLVFMFTLRRVSRDGRVVFRVKRGALMNM